MKTETDMLPWFMYWKPVSENSSVSEYKWYARPFAPVYVAWCDMRLNQEKRRLERSERGNVQLRSVVKFLFLVLFVSGLVTLNAVLVTASMITLTVGGFILDRTESGSVNLDAADRNAA